MWEQIARGLRVPIQVEYWIAMDIQDRPPPLDRTSEYIAWYVRYGSELSPIRSLYEGKLDRLVDTCVRGVMKELQAHPTQEALAKRAFELDEYFTWKIWPLVARRRGLRTCPPDLQGAAVSMLVNIATLSSYLHRKYQDDTGEILLETIADLMPGYIDVRNSDKQEPYSTPRQPANDKARATDQRRTSERASPFPVMRAGGKVERVYRIRHFQGVLFSNARAANGIEYRYMLGVSTDDGRAKLMIALERNPMSKVLIEAAKEQFPGLATAAGGKYFLCVTDESGQHRNLGAVTNADDLEAFSKRALQVAQEHLGVQGVMETYRRRSLWGGLRSLFSS
jgi:hypothetical protein